MGSVRLPTELARDFFSSFFWQQKWVTCVEIVVLAEKGCVVEKKEVQQVGQLMERLRNQNHQELQELKLEAKRRVRVRKTSKLLQGYLVGYLRYLFRVLRNTKSYLFDTDLISTLLTIVI